MHRQHFFSIIFLAALAALLLLSACSLQSTSGLPAGQANDLVNQIVTQTFAALTQAAGEAAQVTATIPAQESSTLEFTPTVTLTPTPGIVQVSVSRETNCRTGPGPVYEALGILRVGQTAEVVGRNFINDNWIIKLSSNPAIVCWVWGQYATVSGNWEALPIIKTPPTPTPTVEP